MSKDKTGRRGQIFTLDVLLALIGITVLLGTFIQYQTLIKNRGSDSQYLEMKTLAKDAAQIAVKRTAVKGSKANTLDSSKQSNLQSLMNDLTGQRYQYEVGGAISINGGACVDSKDSASYRRIIKNQTGQMNSLHVTICSSGGGST